MRMALKDGKRKVLTLSYDDGVVQDIRLIKIMNQYGLKGTFNINTGRYCPEDTVREQFDGTMKLSEAQELYIKSGHEVAIHSYSHPFLEQVKPEEVVFEILRDRENVEKQYGTIAKGMAYPYGTYNDQVIEILRQCGIVYSRTVKSTENFGFPQDWLTLDPTCHHNDPQLMELAKRFAEEEPLWDRAWMFYLWGHSYEFDRNDNWNVIEEFAAYIGNREDIWYATNLEVYNYVRAYESLQVSVDQTILYNPSAIDVWVNLSNRLGETNIVKIGAGETRRF